MLVQHAKRQHGIHAVPDALGESLVHLWRSV